MMQESLAVQILEPTKEFNGLVAVDHINLGIKKGGFSPFSVPMGQGRPLP